MTRRAAVCTRRYRFRTPITIAVAGFVLLSLSLSAVMTQTAPQAALSAGRFLVASKQLRDPNFSETVVLLLNYGERGARGVVINWPTEVKLATMFPEIRGLQRRVDTAYLGGPVERTRLLMLLRADKPRSGAEHVVDDIYVSTNRRVLFDALGRAGSATSVHVYAGYAGWAPGQLDREVARGDWHVLPADAEAVFSTTPNEVWRELIDKGAVQWL
jgi:putative transcriptional regulator